MTCGARWRESRVKLLGTDDGVLTNMYKTMNALHMGSGTTSGAN